MSVIGAVEPTLRQAEVERARRKRPDNLDAYDLFLRALPFATPPCRKTPTGRSISWRRRSGWSRTTPPRTASSPGAMSSATCAAGCTPRRVLARRHARAAIEAGSDDAMALAMGGFVLGIVERDYDTRSRPSTAPWRSAPPRRSLSASARSSAPGWATIPTAIEHARIGTRLSPYDPLIYLPYVGLAYAHSSRATSSKRRAPRAAPPRPTPGSACPAICTRRPSSASAGPTKPERWPRSCSTCSPASPSAGWSPATSPPGRMSLLAGALRELGLPE